jgi:hypothetical protein
MTSIPKNIYVVINTQQDTLLEDGQNILLYIEDFSFPPVYNSLHIYVPSL